jgi:hypothetical protein
LPSFTVQVPNLRQAGPVLELQIAVGTATEEALQRAGDPVPTPVRAIGLIDTGASVSVVRRGLLSQLGMQPVGVMRINTPSSTNVTCDEYLVRFVLPNGIVLETTALEAPLQSQHIQCLIGRDVLAQTVLVYIGYSNQLTLSF